MDTTEKRMDGKIVQIANDNRLAANMYLRMLLGNLAYRHGLAYDIVTREIGPYEPQDPDRETPIYRKLRNKR